MIGNSTEWDPALFSPLPKETPFSKLLTRMDTAKYAMGLFKHVSLKKIKIKYVALFTFSAVLDCIHPCYTQPQENNSHQNMQETSLIPSK